MCATTACAYYIAVGATSGKNQSNLKNFQETVSSAQPRRRRCLKTRAAEQSARRSTAPNSTRGRCASLSPPSSVAVGLGEGDGRREALGEAVTLALDEGSALGGDVGEDDGDGDRRGVAEGAGVAVGDELTAGVGVGVGGTQSGSMVKRTTRCST